MPNTPTTDELVAKAGEHASAAVVDGWHYTDPSCNTLGLYIDRKLRGLVTFCNRSLHPDECDPHYDASAIRLDRSVVNLGSYPDAEAAQAVVDGYNGRPAGSR